MVTTTTIEQGHNERWYWHTKAASGDIVADQGQGNGYATAQDALNGFLSSQGHPDWQPGKQLPDGYTLSARGHDGTGNPQTLIVLHDDASA